MGAVVVVGCLAAGVLGQVQPRSVERSDIASEPEIRDRFYDRTAERYLKDFVDAYALTETQREQVAARLEQLKEEQKTYTQARERESAVLREEMRALSQARRTGEKIDEKRLRELSGKMRALYQDAPLLSPNRVAQEVEKLLPPEQVSQGRPRWETTRQQRLNEWGDRLGESREREATVRGARDLWPQYVDAFCREFNLDETQKATALSALRDVMQQRDKYLTDHAPEIEAAARASAGEPRREQMAQALAPVNALFEELKTRLDRIPTSSQIESFRKRAATQPASQPTSRPATATRPTDWVRLPLAAGWPEGQRVVRRVASRPATR